MPQRVAPDRRDFSAEFAVEFAELLAWRRDVRHFRSDPVDAALLEGLLDLACLAPSVGNAQPWRFVSVQSLERRNAITENFRSANAEALAGYAGDKARLYARLKLAGLTEAPCHLAVFCDEQTEQGAGLGRKTMPETLRYSTALAVHTLWLAARVHGLGIGWVSILDPAAAKTALDVPPDWSLVAYLCLGHPQFDHVEPELQRVGWQPRTAECRQVITR